MSQRFFHCAFESVWSAFGPASDIALGTGANRSHHDEPKSGNQSMSYTDAIISR